VELAAAIELVLSKPIQQQDPSSESEMTRLVSATLTRCASGAR